MIVGEVIGLVTVGVGGLAPTVESPQVFGMLRETFRRAWEFTGLI